MGNNRHGAAGLRGTDPGVVVAFLDHYTYADPRRIRRINGVRITPAEQRQIRRWRNGDTGAVSKRGLDTILAHFGFGRAWYESWVKGLTGAPK